MFNCLNSDRHLLFKMYTKTNKRTVQAKGTKYFFLHIFSCLKTKLKQIAISSFEIIWAKHFWLFLIFVSFWFCDGLLLIVYFYLNCFQDDFLSLSQTIEITTSQKLFLSYSFDFFCRHVFFMNILISTHLSHTHV